MEEGASSMRSTVALALIAGALAMTPRPASAVPFALGDHAVFHFGIIDKLEHLPTDYLPIGAYEEGALLPAGLEEAAQILRTAAAELKQETCDVKVSTRWKPERLELWMTIDIQAL